jgi:hypothetical protein
MQAGALPATMATMIIAMNQAKSLMVSRLALSVSHHGDDGLQLLDGEPAI